MITSLHNEVLNNKLYTNPPKVTKIIATFEVKVVQFVVNLYITSVFTSSNTIMFVKKKVYP